MQMSVGGIACAAQEDMDEEERALVAQANGRPAATAQEAAAEAAEEGAEEAADQDGDAMDLEDEDPSQMTIVRNYQRPDPR